MQTDSASYTRTFKLGGLVDERLLLRAIAENNNCTMRHSLDTGITTVTGQRLDVKTTGAMFYSIQQQMYLQCALAEVRMLLKGQPTKKTRTEFVEAYVTFVCMKLPNVPRIVSSIHRRENDTVRMAKEAASKVVYI